VAELYAADDRMARARSQFEAVRIYIWFLKVVWEHTYLRTHGAESLRN
jgi:hypothetical protein